MHGSSMWQTSRGVQCFLTPDSLAEYVAAMMSYTANEIFNVEWWRTPYPQLRPHLMLLDCKRAPHQLWVPVLLNL